MSYGTLHTVESTEPGTESFTAGLAAAFRTQVRAEVAAAYEAGVKIVGLDSTGRRVELHAPDDASLTVGLSDAG